MIVTNYFIIGYSHTGEWPCKLLRKIFLPLLSAVLYIDRIGNKYSGTLINPSKIQNINQNQGLFRIELDEQMKGLNLLTGKSNTLTKINGLASYNNWDKSIQFKFGNIAALTATFTK